MKARDLMVQPVISVKENLSLEEVARLLITCKISCVPVTDAKGDLAGIITESDFMSKDRGIPFVFFHAPEMFGKWLGLEGMEELRSQARAMPARDYMTSPVICVEEDAPAEEVEHLMLRHRIRRIPVIHGGAPVGIITYRDMLRLMLPENTPGSGAAATLPKVDDPREAPEPAKETPQVC